MTRNRPAVVVAVAVLSATVPAVATADGSAALDLIVEDRDDGVGVTVTENGSAVANATVAVTSVGVIARDDYAGAGTYCTGENGTVSLPDPETDVTVRVTASVGDSSAVQRVRLGADDGEPPRRGGPLARGVASRFRRQRRSDRRSRPARTTHLPVRHRKRPRYRRLRPARPRR